MKTGINISIIMIKAFLSKNLFPGFAQFSVNFSRPKSWNRKHFAFGMYDSRWIIHLRSYTISSATLLLSMSKCFRTYIDPVSWGRTPDLGVPTYCSQRIFSIWKYSERFAQCSFRGWRLFLTWLAWFFPSLPNVSLMDEIYILGEHPWKSNGQCPLEAAILTIDISKTFLPPRCFCFNSIKNFLKFQINCIHSLQNIGIKYTFGDELMTPYSGETLTP